MAATGFRVSSVLVLLLGELCCGGEAAKKKVDKFCPPDLLAETDRLYLQVYNGSCFHFALTRRRLYSDANRDCQKHGGTLALPKTESMNDFLADTLLNTYGKMDEAWIGLHDKKDENKFVWEDHSDLEWDNFASGNGPDNNIAAKQFEDCVALDPEDGFWRNFQCVFSALSVLSRSQPNKMYICQYTLDLDLDVDDDNQDTDLPGKAGGGSGGNPKSKDDEKGKDQNGGAEARATTTQATRCPPAWIQHQDNCFQLNSTPTRTYTGAISACASQGSQLADLSTRAARDRVTAQLTRYRTRQFLFHKFDASTGSYNVWTINALGSNEAFYPTLYYSYICEKPAVKVETGCPMITRDFLSFKGSFASPDKCYYLYTSGAYRPGAVSKCRYLSASLATMPDRETYSFISSKLPKNIPEIWTALSRSGNTYTWPSGEKVDYLPWGKSHTGAESADCVSLILQGDLHLHAVSCYRFLPYLCETPRKGSPSLDDKPALMFHDCPEKWKTRDEFCYKIFFSRLTWREAEAACVKEGGHLLSLHSEEETTFIHQTFPTSSRNVFAYWLGMSNLNQNKQLSWSDGSAFDYSKWVPMEPNGLKEECIEVKDDTMMWNDIMCDSRLYSVCKKRRGTYIVMSPTTPVTTTLTTSMTTTPTTAVSTTPKIPVTTAPTTPLSTIPTTVVTTTLTAAVTTITTTKTTTMEMQTKSLTPTSTTESNRPQLDKFKTTPVTTKMTMPPHKNISELSQTPQHPKDEPRPTLSLNLSLTVPPTLKAFSAGDTDNDSHLDPLLLNVSSVFTSSVSPDVIRGTHTDSIPSQSEASLPSKQTSPVVAIGSLTAGVVGVILVAIALVIFGLRRNNWRHYDHSWKMPKVNTISRGSWNSLHGDGGVSSREEEEELEEQPPEDVHPSPGFSPAASHGNADPVRDSALDSGTTDTAFLIADTVAVTSFGFIPATPMKGEDSSASVAIENLVYSVD